MFENIGGKLKGLASAVTWIGIVASVIYGAVLISGGTDEAISIGLIVMVAGSLVSWLSSFALYGFGELIDKTASIEAYLKKGSADETEENNAAE